ncbi:hypothetical protein D3871_11540 [Noviherbaspirillum saxi]|uniref:Uncharacterized protein n=1 Tax=Noviherbaspirillum saxi TaxID=2320863 RepID=A0A3A3FS83_9BURK|nr:hypothetical protein D3871_11540 [Noviherbaspirillum saxi]
MATQSVLPLSDEACSGGGSPTAVPIYFMDEPPRPAGPGAAGLPDPTPMPEPGTESGLPCASFDP